MEDKKMNWLTQILGIEKVQETETCPHGKKYNFETGHSIDYCNICESENS